MPGTREEARFVREVQALEARRVLGGCGCGWGGGGGMGSCFCEGCLEGGMGGFVADWCSSTNIKAD